MEIGRKIVLGIALAAALIAGTGEASASDAKGVAPERAQAVLSA
ncbi:MAG TPA: hypothetical protein VFS76_11045 [Pyrinomonadaceae bacterium]|nr:hypothetical protein [Pyrinomonadaceae bacterium]